MVIFRQVIAEKNEKLLELTNLNLSSLIRIMENGGYNVVSLAKDRILYFDKENPSRYKENDLHVLANSDEMFDQVILFKLEPSRIEAAVERKEYLLQHMFIEAKTPESTTETLSLTTNEYKSIIDKIDQIAVRLPEIEIKSPINSSEDPDRQLPLIENIMNLFSDHFIDKLEDDYASIQKQVNLEQAADTSFDSNEEKQLLHYVQMTFNNQQLILKKVRKF
ncbi:unnamed protein product [Rotaria sp. Silwood2]|nr:unnamed protein product [Rotaria sp. Silwood2]CAF2936952.1 unnamed protein product [Rotaria sp. Silwood2]CAF3384004.1 unnamed protein product [Rotaria sp. Silwood2]CAF3388256.1 unnamed protein product [Rotaria sp. Silwood2]CAF4139414.1 unnamed protein product [Rotaria sp. Silwood2]